MVIDRTSIPFKVTRPGLFQSILWVPGREQLSQVSLQPSLIKDPSLTLDGLGAVVHSCNPGTGEAQAGGS
jgi:hypothetical protein